MAVSNPLTSSVASALSDTPLFAGSMVALVSPFQGQGGERLNVSVLEKLIDHQLTAGTDVLIPCGTTGESPTLEEEEFVTITTIAVQKTRGTATKVVVGTGSNSTKASLQRTQRAAELGADGCLIVTPYYNKPTPEGMLAHFRELDKVGIPLMAYNVPGRTGVNLTPQTILEIATLCRNVVAVKASNGDVDQIGELTSLIARRSSPLTVVSGDDSLTLPIMAVGGQGVVSVAANLIPRVMKSFVASINDGEFFKAQRISWALHEFSNALLRIASNPIPIKALLNSVGIAVGPCRLPLVDLSPELSAQLAAKARAMRETLQRWGLPYDPILEQLEP